MSKRRIIQLATVTAAAFLALGAVIVTGSVVSAKYQRDLEYNYRRAFNELTTYVSTMESTLSKSIYANTATQQTGIAAKLMQDASGAKSSLSVLPLQGDTLNTVQKFLSQVEDFSTALTKQVSSGIGISDKDRETLSQLYDYAALLKADLAHLQQQFDRQDLQIGESTRLISNLELDPSVPVFSDALSSSAEDFQDYPTLIYDGPFSDHITQLEPKLLKGKPEVDEAEAIDKAASFFALNKNDLQHTSDTAGNLPTINLTDGTKKISVTKQGGEILSLLDTRNVESASLDYEQAKQKAEEFLQKNNFGPMKESYYVINDNRCTIQFFTEENGAVVYPDLIKITVALDNGDIAEYNSTGYLMNHHQRKIPQPKITLEEAKKAISPALTIQKERMAVIPTAGLHEVLCYEFLCDGKNGDEVLVYLNAETGMEEQIFLVLRSDNGVLTI
ncbi:MAG: germination protein YpeB [Oscillospiraceae bacterium]|nr:germination protein YpeB [Oscillospiraceae bacterium]